MWQPSLVPLKQKVGVGEKSPLVSHPHDACLPSRTKTATIRNRTWESGLGGVWPREGGVWPGWPGGGQRAGDGRHSTSLPAAAADSSKSSRVSGRGVPRSLWGSRGLVGANPVAFVDVEWPVVRLREQE